MTEIDYFSEEKIRARILQRQRKTWRGLGGRADGVQDRAIRNEDRRRFAEDRGLMSTDGRPKAEEGRVLIALACLIALITMTWLAAGATVQGYVRDRANQLTATNVQFKALQNILVDDPDVFPGWTLEIMSDTNGYFSTTLVQGDYQVTYGGNIRQTFIISVPNDTNIYNIVSLVTNAPAFNFPFSPIYQEKVYKGQTDGYAALSSIGTVPPAQLGTNPVADYFLKTDGTNTGWAEVAAGAAAVPRFDSTTYTFDTN